MEEVYPVLSLRERERRWKRVKGLMKENALNCLIVAGLSSREQLEGYLTNEYCHGVVVFPLEGEPTYLTWSSGNILRHIENLDRGGTPWINDIRVGVTGTAWVNVLLEKGLESATIGVVGLESRGPYQPEGYIPYKTWAYVLERLPKVTFVEVSELFTNLILVNSEEELAVVRHCAQIGEAACQAMLKVIKPGVSESEIYAAVMNVIYINGASALWPNLILHTGVANISWDAPMWTYQAQRPRIVQKGEVVMAELFPYYGGKETQQQMTVALKPVHSVNRQLAEVAHRSYEAGLRALRPGNTFREVAEAMEMPITEAGCWHQTPLIHSLNPLLGIVGPSSVGIEQVPGIENYGGVKQSTDWSRVSKLVLKPGMVFELEPNASLGKRKVNIGGPVLVTEDGVEELNKLATEMVVVD
jgi:Xaa-Pro dipeptidase